VALRRRYQAWWNTEPFGWLTPILRIDKECAMQSNHEFNPAQVRLWFSLGLLLFVLVVVLF
jgi:hypothetical protein